LTGADANSVAPLGRRQSQAPDGRAVTAALAVKVLSLFTGAGGLDLGLETAGFKIAGCVEIDVTALQTLGANRRSWPLAQRGDVVPRRPKDLIAEFGLRRGEVTVVSAGPPCQPWSGAARWVDGAERGLADPRAQTLRAYLRVVEAALPYVTILENVGGLAPRGAGPGAIELLRRGFARMNRKAGTHYEPVVLRLNAADYGVPQHRERVFLVAARDGAELHAPVATHGPAAGAGNGHLPQPLATTWDAIGDLDDPEFDPACLPSGRWAGLLPSVPEGQNYLWHTPRGGGEPLFGWRRRYWSFLLKLAKDRPSWTLQAHPGPATGPFHWRSRRLTTEEMARLQTFPPGYRVQGSYDERRRQLGNAVPAAIGELLGLEIRRQLLGQGPRRNGLRLLPAARDDCPPAERPAKVPKHYLALRGDHPDHPGAGEGPRARHTRTRTA
jgi:DNA (cytosine-5)-methyltransferase 1